MNRMVLWMIMALLVMPAWAQGFEAEGEKEASGSEISSGGDTGGEKEEGGDLSGGGEGDQGGGEVGSGGGQQTDAVATFVIQNNEQEPVVQLYLSVGPQGRAQEAPYLQIFGTGTMRVQKPGSNRSLDRRIDREKVNKLVTMLSQKGVMAFDEAETLAIKQAIDSDRNSRPLTDAEQAAQVYIDDNLTRIEINLEQYTAAGSSRAVRKFHKQVNWVGLAGDARKYPSIQAIQYLSEAINELLETAAR